MDELKKLEEERKRVYKKNKLGVVIAVLSFIIGFIVLNFVPILGIIIFVIGIIVMVVLSQDSVKFKKVFKESVVKSLIKQELGVEAVYKMNDGISIEEINSLCVASKPDRYHLEDYISCKYNDVPYEMCDCTLEEKHVTYDSKGNRHVSYQKYFMGRIIKIDFKRNLNMELRVVNNPTTGFRYGNLVPFETEVIDFNRKFKCYASSKEDGFYLLTPVLIQKMSELEGMYRGGIYYIISKGVFYIFINNSGDSLEVSLSKPLDDKQLAKIKSDILIGASIINEFRVDSDKFNVDR